MNRKLLSFFVLLIWVLSTLACLPGGLLGGKEAAQPTPAEISKPTTVAPTTPPEPTPAPAAELGEEHRSDFGGFAFQTIAGYTLEEESGSVSMEAPEADSDIGPIIMLMGSANEESATTEELYDEFVGEFAADTEISEPREITIGGVPGLVSEVSGDSEGTKVTGRLVIVAVTPTQRFIMVGGAPSERWDGELAPLFDAVLASVSFFEPTAAEEQPAMPAPAPAAELGEKHRNFGGFAFQTIAGYTLKEEMGFVSMEAPDADPELGPFILLMGGVVEETTTKQLFDDFASDAEMGVEMSEPREITVGGAPGLVSDISGDSEGTKATGRFVIVAVTPTQRFIMGGVAPSERWDGELAPLFDAVLASVSFFEPTIAEEQPAEAEPSAAAEEEEPASGAPSSVPNLTGLPLLDDAEEVYCMDEYNLNYWTRVDLVTALTFYRQELPALGWQLDYQDGKCLDDRRLTRRCMGWHGGYDNPEETPLFFLRGDGEYLTLNASEEAGRVNIIISIDPDVYAD